MSLVILGQSAGPTSLSANDDQFGLMTQDPTGAVKHNEAGLTNENASTAFGAPFTLACYFTTSNPTAGRTTLSKALCSSDCPYKLRVLRAKATLLDDADALLNEGLNSLTVKVVQAADSVCSADLSDMAQSEERDIPLGRTGGEVIAADGSLTVSCDVVLGETGATNTLTLLVELTCMRVL